MFYPLSLVAKPAKGDIASEPKLASGMYETDEYDEIPTTNSMTVCGEDGTVSVFVVSRSVEAINDSVIRLPEGSILSTIEVQTLYEDDLLAKNTLEGQSRVVLYPNTIVTSGAGTDAVRMTLSPASWIAVHVR